MPVTRRDHRQGFTDFKSALGGVDTAAFLFGDDAERPERSGAPRSRPTSGILSLSMSNNDDGFPVLNRSDTTSAAMSQSASSDHLDLAPLNHNSEPEQDDGGWPSAFVPAHSNRASMPPISSHYASSFLRSDSPPAGVPLTSGQASPPKFTTSNRHSTGASLSYSDVKRPGLFNAPGVPNNSNGRVPPKVQTSFSTSSVPTMSSLNGGKSNGATTPTANASHNSAEQRLHNHNVSLGRIPAGAISNNRHSRDLSTIMDSLLEPKVSSPPSNSMLHAQAPSWGPVEVGTRPFATMPQPNLPESAGGVTYESPQTSSAQGYGMPSQIPMQTLDQALASMQLPQLGPAPMYQQMQNYSQPAGYGMYQQPMGHSRGQDSQSRAVQHRRNQGPGGELRHRLIRSTRLTFAQKPLVSTIFLSRASKARSIASARISTAVAIFRRSLKSVLKKTSSSFTTRPKLTWSSL